MQTSGRLRTALVIGGGIIGSSIAWRLAKCGVSVTLIEAHSPAARASSNSFGWINATAAESSQYYELRSQAIADYRQLLDRASADSSLTNAPLSESPLKSCVSFAGSMWWEKQGDELSDLGARLHNYGHSLRQINADEFAQLEPNVANPPESCLYSEFDGAAEGDKLTQFFLQQASRSGASILMGVALEKLLVASARVTGAVTSHGTFESDVVVLATGAATSKLADSVGIKVPMENKQGLIVHTHPVAPVINSVINSDDIHFRQAADGHVVMGEIFSGGSLGANQGESPAQFAKELLRRLKNRLPGVEGLAIERIQLGTRPVPQDGFPVVGMPGALTGLYLVTTHSGITLAPLLGRLVAEELVEGRRSPLLDAYHPDRFIV